MYSLHPGYNADPINGDDMDGSGTNWPLWSVLFDTYEGLQPMIIGDEELAVFDGCADIVFGCENRTIVFSRENTTVTIRRAG